MEKPPGNKKLPRAIKDAKSQSRNTAEVMIDRSAADIKQRPVKLSDASTYTNLMLARIKEKTGADQRGDASVVLLNVPSTLNVQLIKSLKTPHQVT